MLDLKNFKTIYTLTKVISFKRHQEKLKELLVKKSKNKRKVEGDMTAIMHLIK